MYRWACWRLSGGTSTSAGALVLAIWRARECTDGLAGGCPEVHPRAPARGGAPELVLDADRQSVLDHGVRRAQPGHGLHLEPARPHGRVGAGQFPGPLERLHREDRYTAQRLVRLVAHRPVGDDVTGPA